MTRHPYRAKMYREAMGEVCSNPECGSAENISVHHITSLNRGGEDRFWNMITLCRACHFRYGHTDALVNYEQLFVWKGLREQDVLGLGCFLEEAEYVVPQGNHAPSLICLIKAPQEQKPKVLQRKISKAPPKKKLVASQKPIGKLCMLPSSASYPIFKIPSIELETIELLRRLRGLIDIVADPDLSIKDPAAYTQAYVRLLNLIARHPKKMKSKHVLHNLGEVRVNFLKNLTGNIYVRPDYRKKTHHLNR